MSGRRVAGPGGRPGRPATSTARGARRPQSPSGPARRTHRAGGSRLLVGGAAASATLVIMSVLGAGSSNAVSTGLSRAPDDTPSTVAPEPQRVRVYVQDGRIVAVEPLDDSPAGVDPFVPAPQAAPQPAPGRRDGRSGGSR